ncbi:MAG: alpha/beta fold hydrolase, partial [Thiolinea sp.]
MSEAVVLLHGIWMRPLVMSSMARYLHQQGYRVFVPAYTSLRRSPAVNARHLLKRYQQDLSHFDAVHLVGHSLGGLVALHLLAHCPELPPGRLVTLGSPIQGSQVAR